MAKNNNALSMASRLATNATPYLTQLIESISNVSIYAHSAFMSVCRLCRDLPILFEFLDEILSAIETRFRQALATFHGQDTFNSARNFFLKK